jgi:hypothetical protein
MDPLLIDLSCKNFYIELQCLNILKHLSKISRAYLKLLLFSKNYPVRENQ